MKPGLNAIMGATGSGKSSWVCDVLSLLREFLIFIIIRVVENRAKLQNQCRDTSCRSSSGSWMFWRLGRIPQDWWDMCWLTVLRSLPISSVCQDTWCRWVSRTGKNKGELPVVEKDLCRWWLFFFSPGRRGHGDVDRQGEPELLGSTASACRHSSRGERAEGQQADPGAGTGPGRWLQGN